MRMRRGKRHIKTPVVGIKERSSSHVKIVVAKRDGRQLLEFIRTACKSTTTVITDKFSGYNVLNNQKTKFFLLTINHSLGQYSDHKGTHTNGIESVWALIKRGVYGMYHHVSVKYLQNYINEFCFRLNNRKNKGVFDTLLKQCLI